MQAKDLRMSAIITNRTYDDLVSTGGLGQNGGKMLLDPGQITLLNHRYTRAFVGGGVMIRGRRTGGLTQLNVPNQQRYNTIIETNSRTKYG